MTQDIIILGAKQYSFKDERNELKEGTTVYYINAADMQQRLLSDMAGYLPCKHSIGYDFYEVVKALGGVPLKATGEFEMRGTRNGTELKLIDVVIDQDDYKLVPEKK